jgi:DinB family
MEISNVESFLSYFESIRARTSRVIACIPPERIEWTHRPGAFTLGDLGRHIAATELADGYDAVLAFFERSHGEAMEIFRALTPDDLARKCATPAGTPIVTWKWLRAMVEHEVHHRGQIYLMLGMLGVSTPPLYGLTSEQVREQSLPIENGRGVE